MRTEDSISYHLALGVCIHTAGAPLSGRRRRLATGQPGGRDTTVDGSAPLKAGRPSVDRGSCCPSLDEFNSDSLETCSSGGGGGGNRSPAGNRT